MYIIINLQETETTPTLTTQQLLTPTIPSSYDYGIYVLFISKKMYHILPAICEGLLYNYRIRIILFHKYKCTLCNKNDLKYIMWK